MPGRDTRTGKPGVFARHREGCAVEKLPPRPTPTQWRKACRCKPSYYGVAWDRDRGKTKKTKRFPSGAAAESAKRDLEKALRDGTVSDAATTTTVGEIRTRFIKSARDGVALNKWGRRYRPTAVDDLQTSLKHLPEKVTKRRPADVSRGDVQALVDELNRRGMSGSRVRSVVNAIRSMYRWAQDREMVNHDPAALVRLPAMDAKPRDRVATPPEMVNLIDALELRDAVPHALAIYTSARRQEIRILDWEHVDTEQFLALELAADEDGRKPGGSWRMVPQVKPLRQILRREWIRQGRPKSGKVCPPRNAKNTSGMLALGGLQARLQTVWEKAGLQPILLHECRHTTATWLDHAGVSPKIVSMWMGHKTPEYQPGAAAITLGRYTHSLPGELERARDQLDAFIAQRIQEETG